MIIAIILLSAALIAQTLYMLIYRNQIKDIGNQLSFISEHQSFKFIHMHMRNKEMYQLVQSCNHLLRSQRELNQKFIQKNEEVNTTIVSLSHDIRTPLTSLGGYLQLAERAEDCEEKSSYIHLALTRMKQITSLVDELFYYTKLQNRQYALELEALDVIDMLHKRLFSVIDEFSRLGKEPDMYLPESPVYIFGNAKALERVFENILSNYFLHGNGNLCIRYEDKLGEATLHFTNQVGENHNIEGDKVFTRFYKVDPSRTLHSTGLGLSIVQSLMEKMNGNAKVQVDGNLFCLSATFKKNGGAEHEHSTGTTSYTGHRRR
ncbi:sensor histidine kinase [Paenibacillus septentrionalis]|uniref:histidine kinase n=1 Tax=Paenibacillus septentrionalis TaxID=429342 RepID=A0ABW1V2F6_9BACL